MQWDGDFSKRSAIFSELAVDAESFKRFAHWPTVLQSVELLLPHLPANANTIPLRFVNQHELEMDKPYESYVFEDGIVPTRHESWHDFFQLFIWKYFPASKAAINALHYHESFSSEKTANNRTLKQNAAAVFDENGLVVLSSDLNLLEDFCELRWRKLFFEQKDLFRTKICCHIFGHSLYEKALQSYIGMTGHALLLHCTDAFIEQTKNQQREQLDSYISAAITNGQLLCEVEQLNPVPLLGVPGWWHQQETQFYDNTQYFRQRWRGQTRTNATIFPITDI